MMMKCERHGQVEAVLVDPVLCRRECRKCIEEVGATDEAGNSQLRQAPATVDFGKVEQAVLAGTVVGRFSGTEVLPQTLPRGSAKAMEFAEKFSPGPRKFIFADKLKGDVADVRMKEFL